MIQNRVQYQLIYLNSTLVLMRHCKELMEDHPDWRSGLVRFLYSIAYINRFGPGSVFSY